MKRLKKSQMIATLVAVLLLTSAFLLMSSIPVQAQAMPEYDTVAYLGFRPSPVGVGQTVLVNMWIKPATHVGRKLTGFQVTITKPSGQQSVETMDSYYGDATAWFEFVADEVGEWKIRFDFLGTQFPEETLAGGFMEPPTVTLQPCYYKPSTTGEQTLVVQEDIVYSWPDEGLPTDYWTRPISPEHREWWSIAGNYPWTSQGGSAYPGWPAETNAFASNYKFIPWVQAPNTAHIAWKRQAAIAGLIGGTMYHSSLGGMSRGSGAPSVIYSGRCFESITKPGGENVLQCYDIRTGEVYWEISPNPIPMTMGFFGPSPGSIYLTYQQPSPETPGAESRSGESVNLVSLGSRLVKIDPWSGTITMNVSGMSGTLYNDPYVVSTQTLPDGSARLITWTTEQNAGDVVYAPGGGQPTTTDFAARVRSNVTWPLTSGFGNVYDYESMIGASVSTISEPTTGVWIGTRLRAASMITGELLWEKTITDACYSGSTAVADHGKVAFACNNMYWMAFNLNDGSLAWKSELTDYPWGCWWGYTVASAYGNVYGLAYDGVYAFDWDTGKINWKYEAPTEFVYETPYDGLNSFMGGIVIADGKVYSQNNEHTPTSPITRGWKLHCIDAFTGDGIWSITGSMTPGAIADGYLTAGNMYDGYMYVFGKGLSETTVSAPQTSVAVGTAMTITGTVLDLSPAQSGTPCVSADSMALQMEYLHLQRPIDGIHHDAVITGVPVTVTAIGSDGSCVDIGTTTSSGYYGSFGISWTPTEQGTYEIVASFAGDDSYGSSGASTFVTVGPATAASSGIEQETPIISTEVAIIVVVVAVAAVAAVAYVAARKRK